jgi:hypothetical protein
MASSTAFGSTTWTQAAQGFTALAPTLTEVRCGSFNKNGTPAGNLIVEVQTDSAGKPSGTVVGTVVNVAPASVTPGAQIFPCNIALTTGNTYWLVFRMGSADSATNCYSIGQTNSGLLQGFGFETMASGGTTWSAQGAVSYNCRVTFQNPISTYYLNDAAAGISPGTPIAKAAQQTRAVDTSQTQTNFINTSSDSFTGNGRIAQQFTALTSAVPVTKVTLQAVFYSGTQPADNLIVEIYNDNSGAPGSTLIGSVGTVAGSSLLTSTQSFALPCNISLVSGTKYWIIYRRSNTADTTTSYGFSVADSTITSPAFPILQVSSNGGSTWANDTFAHSLNVVLLYGTPAAAVNSVTNTAAGPVTPIQVTATGGGTAIEWYTPALNGFTLAGKTKFNIRGLESSAAANSSLKAEIAVCAGNGTSPVVWGIANLEATQHGGYGEVPTTDTALFAWVDGPSTVVTTGQRLRFRIYVDDCADVPLVTAFNTTVSYNGPTSAAAGDTFVILPVAVTEVPTGPAHSLVAPARREQYNRLTRWY